MKLLVSCSLLVWEFRPNNFGSCGFCTLLLIVCFLQLLTNFALFIFCVDSLIVLYRGFFFDYRCKKFELIRLVILVKYSFFFSITNEFPISVFKLKQSFFFKICAALNAFLFLWINFSFILILKFFNKCKRYSLATSWFWKSNIFIPTMIF